MNIFDLRRMKKINDELGGGMTFDDLLEIFGVELWNYLAEIDPQTQTTGDDKENVRARLPTLNLDKLKVMAINEALVKANYSQKDASSLLGISKRELNYQIVQLGFTHPNWRKNKGAVLEIEKIIELNKTE